MNGIQIQYLLGIFFAVTSISYAGNVFKVNFFLLGCGIVLVLLSALGFSLIS